METQHFLDEFVATLADEHVDGAIGVPWYNQHGDCIMFQTADEATIADRIDSFLTLYRSAVDERVIGFCLKDVMTLIQKYGYEGLSVSAGVKGDRVVSVRALLLAAYSENPATIHRRRGYASAPAPGPGEDEVRIDRAA